MSCKNQNLPDFFKGTDFRETEVEIINDDTNSPLDLTGYSIKGVFRYGSTEGRLQKTIEIGSGITLSDPTNGIFDIDSFQIDWDAGTYVYDFLFTSPEGIESIYITGSMKIKNATNK